MVAQVLRTGNWPADNGRKLRAAIIPTPRQQDPASSPSSVRSAAHRTSLLSLRNIRLG
jgi:hypothetical protein